MPLSPLHRAASSVLKRSLKLGGVDVVVRRGGQSTASFTATLGQTDNTGEQADVSTVEARTHDFLVPVSSLSFSGATSIPERGDIFAVNQDGVETLFKALSPGGGIPCWRYSDPGRTFYRVRTKEVPSGTT